MKTDVFEPLEGFIPQGFKHSALNNAKQGIGVFKSIEGLARAPRPTQGHAHRLCSLFGRCRSIIDHIGRAFIEHHDDVRVQFGLNPHRLFGCEKKFRAINGRREFHAFFRNFAHPLKTKDLKATGVCEQGF